jgi:hypothetical protein
MVRGGAQLRDVFEQRFVGLRLRARPHLTDDQRFQGRLIGDAADQPQGGDARGAIARVGEVIGDDGGRFLRIWTAVASKEKLFNLCG